MTHETLTALLEARASSELGINFINAADREKRLSYRELYQLARSRLGQFQSAGALPGQFLIIQRADNEQFIISFWACLLGGLIAVPVAPGNTAEHRHKLFRIAKKLDHAWLCTDQNNAERLNAFSEEHSLVDEWQSLSSQLVDDDAPANSDVINHKAAPADPAFIQFSSGSTSAPKGVVLTHKNLITNLDGIISGMRMQADDRFLSWMPLTHDMGLIGFHLTPVMGDTEHFLMPTDLFVRRPALWLKKASEHLITVLCSPNFGYQHFLKSFKVKTAETFDLSNVRLVFNGAEPISVELCQQFMQSLSAAKLDPDTMFPVYGLAEASLAVSFPSLEDRFNTIAVSRNSLGLGERTTESILTPDSDTSSALSFVSVGSPINHVSVRVANAAGEPFVEGTTGHIFIKGENVTAGYFRDDALNASLITEDGWLDTGDLGFFHQGQLYITGRAKDIIFVSGQNVYPHDLEELVIGKSIVERGKLAISSKPTDSGVREELIAFVLHRGDDQALEALATSITRELGESAGVRVDRVVAVPRLPKTTSGKVQRFLLIKNLIAGKYQQVVSNTPSFTEASGTQDSTDGSNDSSVNPSASIDAESTANLSIAEQLQRICVAKTDGMNIGIEDNLFDLGISSLMLAEIHTAIEDTWPGRVDVTDLFDYPTVKELATFLEGEPALSPA